SVIGASWSGIKAMTATSGPGFTLMLEGIGYAIMTETPCVIVDIQRQGPATGQATRPSQGDIMQARWGASGDYQIIALAPWSVEEMYYLTIEAFNLSERFRVPVIILSDEIIAHLKETLTIKEEIIIYEREKDINRPPFLGDGKIPPMPSFGEGANLLITGSTHNEWGVRKAFDPISQEKLSSHLIKKIKNYEEEILKYEEYFINDCEYLIIAFGSVARSALKAVQMLRKENIKVGLFRPITIWPSSIRKIKDLIREKNVILCEMNQGQLIEEVKKYKEEIFSLFKTRGEAIYPYEIYNFVKNL
ncbi:MAG: 2-oxoacid:acceptor oxidoreductase subunit alpha, partial [candidate division WOR-3 bacterium]|nr:2-oxoacid:acceptor oxidoreductase subunit alpha [candidate division WOR-3 bacterium]